MSGLNKILNKINEDSKAKCDAIIAAEEKKCAEIISQAKANGQKAADGIIAAAEKECESIISMARSGAEQTERRALLSAKVEVIADTLKSFRKALLALPEDKYFDLLIKLASENAMNGECTAKLSAKDLERKPLSFKTKLKAALKEKNSDCTLSKDPADIDGGLLLIYGDIEVNCSFGAIIDANADTYKAKISEIIF